METVLENSWCAHWCMEKRVQEEIENQKGFLSVARTRINTQCNTNVGTKLLGPLFTGLTYKPHWSMFHALHLLFNAPEVPKTTLQSSTQLSNKSGE